MWVAIPFSRDFPNPGSPILQADSVPAEPQGKPKNTGVDSLSLLHWMFPTQESNLGLLHCRRILYQLSYQGSPLRYTDPLAITAWSSDFGFHFTFSLFFQSIITFSKKRLCVIPISSCRLLILPILPTRGLNCRERGEKTQE